MFYSSKLLQELTIIVETKARRSSDVMRLLREPLRGISRSAAARYSVAMRVGRMIHIIFVRLLESDVVLLVGQIVDTATWTPKRSAS